MSRETVSSVIGKQIAMKLPASGPAPASAKNVTKAADFDVKYSK
jgi:hypothetical protein